MTTFLVQHIMSRDDRPLFMGVNKSGVYWTIDADDAWTSDDPIKAVNAAKFFATTFHGSRSRAIMHHQVRERSAFDGTAPRTIP